jgi:hypothetical protein
MLGSKTFINTENPQPEKEHSLLQTAALIYGYEHSDNLLEREQEKGSTLPPEEALRLKSKFPKKGIPGVPDYDRIVAIYKDLGDTKKAKLFLFSYVFGGRVTETISFRRMDFRKAVDAEYGEYIEAILLNEKKRGGSIKQVTRFNRIFKDKEPVFYKDVDEYLERFPPSDRIFGRCKRWFAWSCIKTIDFGPIRLTQEFRGRREVVLREHFYGHPHYLRHCRLTHISNTFGFDIHALITYAGWSNMMPAIIYVHSTVKEQGRAFFGSR